MLRFFCFKTVKNVFYPVGSEIINFVIKNYYQHGVTIWYFAYFASLNIILTKHYYEKTATFFNHGICF